MCGCTSHHWRLRDCGSGLALKVVRHLITTEVSRLSGVTHKLMHLPVGQELRVNSWSTSNGARSRHSGREQTERSNLLMNLELWEGQSERRGPEQTGRGTAARGTPLPSQLSSGQLSGCGSTHTY